eukprot:3616678-Pleurochrysis_carterae.AAC.1
MIVPCRCARPHVRLAHPLNNAPSPPSPASLGRRLGAGVECCDRDPQPADRRPMPRLVAPAAPSDSSLAQPTVAKR